MNGYIKIDIGGKERGFYFRNKAIGNILAHFNTTITEVGFMIDNNPWRFFPIAFFYALSAFSEKEKEVVDYTIDDIEDWIDDKGGLKNDDFKKVINVFLVSIGVGLPQEEQTENKEPEEAKKK